MVSSAYPLWLCLGHDFSCIKTFKSARLLFTMLNVRSVLPSVCLGFSWN